MTESGVSVLQLASTPSGGQASASSTTRTPRRRRSRSDSNVDASYRESTEVLFAERDELRHQLEASTDLISSPTQRKRTARVERIHTELIELHQGLVHSYVRRFSATANHHDVEDYVAAGNYGLVQAILSYRRELGNFSAWAYKPIQRAVLQTVRLREHPNLCPTDFERRPAVLQARDLLREGDPSYSPSVEEIAAAAGCAAEQVRRILYPPQSISLSTPRDSSSDGNETTLVDSLPDRAADPAEAAVSTLLVEAFETHGLGCLDERELFVLARRFGLDGEPVQRLTSIGAMLNLSREAVRQIEHKALSKLQHPVVLWALIHGDRRPQMAAA